MSSESDRPVEKRMRDYAAARKAAASPDEFALHPVTRNSLKVEIVKVYGRRFPGESERPLWEKWWPKIAMAGGGVFVLALLIVLAFPSKSTDDNPALTMAKKESAPAPIVQGDMPLPTPDISQARADVSFPQPAALTVNPSPGDVVFEFFVLEPPTKIVASVEVSSSERVALETVAPSETRELEKTLTPLLLATFQFRINGDAVVIIDQDQSRYVGRIRPIDPNLLRASTPATVGAASLGDTSDPDFPTKYRLYSERGSRGGGIPPAGQFSVTGTNLTTRQPVTFTGRMLTWTQAGPTTGSADTPPPSTVLQIEGSVTLGVGTAISINATTKP